MIKMHDVVVVVGGGRVVVVVGGGGGDVVVVVVVEAVVVVAGNVVVVVVLAFEAAVVVVADWFFLGALVVVVTTVVVVVVDVVVEVAAGAPVVVVDDDEVVVVECRVPLLVSMAGSLVGPGVRMTAAPTAAAARIIAAPRTHGNQRRERPAMGPKTSSSWTGKRGGAPEPEERVGAPSAPSWSSSMRSNPPDGASH